MAHELCSEDVFTLMDATTDFRKLLSMGMSRHFSFSPYVINTLLRCSHNAIFISSFNFYFICYLLFHYIGQKPLIGVVIKAGIVPRLVQLLFRQDKPDLQVFLL